MGIVYGLFDPRDGQLRYVGKTERTLRVRLQHHIHRALKQQTNEHKANWIRCLVSQNLCPDIDVLEETGNLTEAEQFWIRYARFLGCSLTNATQGGEGALGYRHSIVARQKMSAAKRGRASLRLGVQHSRESRLKNAASHGGQPFTDGQKVFLTIPDAADDLGVHRTTIQRMLRRGSLSYVEKRNV